MNSIFTLLLRDAFTCNVHNGETDYKKVRLIFRKGAICFYQKTAVASSQFDKKLLNKKYWTKMKNVTKQIRTTQKVKKFFRCIKKSILMQTWNSLIKVVESVFCRKLKNVGKFQIPVFKVKVTFSKKEELSISFLQRGIRPIIFKSHVHGNANDIRVYRRNTKLPWVFSLSRWKKWFTKLVKVIQWVGKC